MRPDPVILVRARCGCGRPPWVPFAVSPRIVNALRILAVAPDTPFSTARCLSCGRLTEQTVGDVLGGRRRKAS